MSQDITQNQEKTISIDTTSSTTSSGIDAAALRCRGITYRYPGTSRAALQDIDVETPPGSITALVGPSGCGKTTLLKLVGGVLPPTQGSIRIGEQDMTRVPVQRRQIGWVPQQYALFDHLDVKANIAFGLRAQKRPSAERRRRVEELLELCRIQELADRSVDDLSGGQRQRVAIARALAPSPKVLLLDEPLAALDPQLRGRLRTDLSAMIRAAGVTTIMVTHDQEEALAMSDHLVLMNTGRIEQSGSPETVWARPTSAWAAEFLGSATVVDVLDRPRAGWVQIAPGLELPVRDDGGEAVAVRALDLEAVPAGGPGVSARQEPQTGVPATVRTIEFGGDGYRGRAVLEIGLELPCTAQQHIDVDAAVTLHPTHRREIPEVRA